MDATTRGKIEGMIKEELEEGILPKIEWLIESMPMNDKLALGYTIGRLEQKALRISLASPYRWTEEQKQEYDRETREIIKGKISDIKNRIVIEGQRYSLK